MDVLMVFIIGVVAIDIIDSILDYKATRYCDIIKSQAEKIEQLEERINRYEKHI